MVLLAVFPFCGSVELTCQCLRDDLSYEIELPHKRGKPKECKSLLMNVSGYVTSGTLVALLGKL
jgi:hypothetical protein